MKTPPGKGREKLPPPAPREPKKPRGHSRPVIKTDEDFDNVLRGLIGVPTKPARKSPRKGR